MSSTYGTIILAAVHSRIYIVKNEQITCDSVNSLKIKFDFRTNDWGEMTKTAIFWNARDYSNNNDDTKISVVLDANGECFIPHEIINQCGKFMVGVLGVNGTKRLPTNYLDFEINQGCYGTCSEELEPTPEVFSQLMTLINSKISSITLNGVALSINNGAININTANILSSIVGYDSTKVQNLQNLNGVFRWVDSE